MNATDKKAELLALRARLMTLPNASVAHGHPPAYYTLRRGLPKWRDHEDPQLRFPEPFWTSNGAEEFDILELALWDARRKQATPQGRAVMKELEEQ